MTLQLEKTSKLYQVGLICRVYAVVKNGGYTYVAGTTVLHVILKHIYLV